MDSPPAVGSEDDVDAPSQYIISRHSGGRFGDVSVDADVDATIRESLDLLNLDYGQDGSHVNSVPSTDVASGSKLPCDSARGLPVFDATPARHSSNDPVASGSIVGDVHQSNLEPPVFYATPVWDDTQSQSVDGTKEVTQEHNVQEQLRKYDDERSVRLKEHNEKVVAYYRRNPSKLKYATSGLTGAAVKRAVCPDPISLVKKVKRKSRVCIRKKPASASPIVQAALASPRCSPRVSAGPSLSRTTHPKRHRSVDKTYVPDADVEHIGNKKRGIGKSDFDDPDGGIDARKKKARVLNKKSCVSNEVESLAGDNAERFQHTVWCSLKEVHDAVKLLEDPHKQKLRLAGFGCVLDWVREGNVSWVLMCYLLKKIDTTTMKRDCASGRVLLVNREAVHHVFGFPIGGVTPPRPSHSGHDASLAKLKAELGFERTYSIETKHLRALLAKL